MGVRARAVAERRATTAPPTPGRDSSWVGGLCAALALVLVAAGAWLRWKTLHSIPSFFGPGDPAIYFGMGRGILREGIPVQDFLHHFLTRPPAIHHLEDYYEPAFGYVVAAAMAIAGGTPQAAAGSAFVAGLLVLPLAGWLTRIRDQAWVPSFATAAVAMAIVAAEPWSIFYSGVLMKEATLALATLAGLHATLKLTRGDGAAWRVGAVAGVIVFAVSLLQYESLPTLAVATGVALFLRRRAACLPFVGTLALLVGVWALLTWSWFGVPVSAKLLFVAGVNPGDPAGASALHVARSHPFPLLYIVGSLLTSWYPLLLVLGLRGLFLPGTDAGMRGWVLAYVAMHIWLHGIPEDLWSRDYIVLTALMAAPAAAALMEWRAWRARPAWGAAAWAVCAFVWIGPPALSLFAQWWPGFAGVAPGLRLLALLPIAALAFWVTRRLLAGRLSPAIAGASSVLFAASLLVQFQLALPWSAIPRNPQFPDFEVERARRERVSEWMRTAVPRGPVIAQHAEEVAYYSTFPAVIMPEVFAKESFAGLLERYDIRYVLEPAGLLPDSVRAALALRVIGEREGYRLLEVPESARDAAPSGAR